MLPTGSPAIAKALIPHRTKVYRFGMVWFWKCQEPDYRCSHGGRARNWDGAFRIAFRHTQLGVYKPSYYCQYCGEWCVQIAFGVWADTVEKWEPDTMADRLRCPKSPGSTHFPLLTGVKDPV